MVELLALVAPLSLPELEGEDPIGFIADLADVPLSEAVRTSVEVDL